MKDTDHIEHIAATTTARRLLPWASGSMRWGVRAEH